MDDATGQLEDYGSEISNLVSGKNGVRFAISKVAELPRRGAVIQPTTQIILHSLLSLIENETLKDYIVRKNNGHVPREI